jgi:N-acetylmuramoyl-L-alanine amidase
MGADGLSAQRDASTMLPARPEAPAGDGTAGADPLEEESAGPAAISGPAEGSAPGSAPAASTLPTWLRAVRDVPPPSVIGTGGSGPKRVGLQVGHWRNEDVPDELRQLRASGGGATGGGYSEVQVNYDLATRTAALLRERGVEVDVLPATVPVDYQADAFVAIHADGDARGALRGYKVARSPLSLVPAYDDALVGWLIAEYGRVTGLPRDDDHISRRMQFYYAFNNRRYYHAIGAGTPAAIVEAGFMTHAADRALLIGSPDVAAAGLTAGLLGFLGLGG